MFEWTAYIMQRVQKLVIYWLALEGGNLQEFQKRKYFLRYKQFFKWKVK